MSDKLLSLVNIIQIEEKNNGLSRLPFYEHTKIEKWQRLRRHPSVPLQILDFKKTS